MFEYHSNTYVNLHLSPVVCLRKFKIGSMDIFAVYCYTSYHWFSI